MQINRPEKPIELHAIISYALFPYGGHGDALRWGLCMAATVQLRNERTGEVKVVKVGWSLTLFLFSSVAGVPLFALGLYKYGAGMAALSVAAAVANVMESPIYGLLILFQLLAAVQFGRLGNRLTALHYLENGWDWVAPDDWEAAYAREKWALA